MVVATDILWGCGLVGVCFISWLLNGVSLPGNWLAVLFVATYSWVGPAAGRASVGILVLAVVFSLALAGEAIEFFASAAGARRAGASRRATCFAIVGSFVGAIFGAVVGLPIPLIGSVLAAIGFGALGAMGGALFGEWSDGRSWSDSWVIGHAAFWGRLLGTAGKVFSGFAILVVVVAAVLL